MSIQQTVDVIGLAIEDALPAVLATMPGDDAAAISAAGVLVSRTLLDPSKAAETPIGVQVEVQETVTETWPIEATEEATTVQVGVTCWIVRSAVPGLRGATDDATIRAIRALVRAVSASIRHAFSPVPVIERDGVQVRCPTEATYGEPEQGEDGALTVMTLSLSVPTLDYWALSAGGV
jgi:hypothetical protein